MKIFLVRILMFLTGFIVLPLIAVGLIVFAVGVTCMVPVVCYRDTEWGWEVLWHFFGNAKRKI